MRPSTFFCMAVFLTAFPFVVLAQDEVTYTANNPQSLIEMALQDIPYIKESRWRNYAYRDLATSIAFIGNTDKAVKLIDNIDNPDTQAMTIRAIGMALAIHKDLPEADYKNLFALLDNKAKTITDEGARDIAYTYIAMAQAFAGLDADATLTTKEMKNDALKWKAYGETAEIQAERGDFDAAMASINAIESEAFRNKSLNIISGLFVKQGDFHHAFKAARVIDNPTKKADALQTIINAQIGLEDVK